MSRKYLWRVAATFAQTVGTVDQPRTVTWTTYRHYQSRQAAEHRAALWREGRPFRYDGHPEGPGQAAIPKAERVVIERSAPVDGWAEVPA